VTLTSEKDFSSLWSGRGTCLEGAIVAIVANEIVQYTRTHLIRRTHDKSFGSKLSAKLSYLC